MRILVVEPEGDFLAMLTFLLRYDGHQVIPARDEAGALALLRAQQPDLVLTEIDLSTGSGWSLCQTIQQARPTPVIFLSCRPTGADQQRGLESGAHAYLTKPLSPRLLRGLIQAVADLAVRSARAAHQYAMVAPTATGLASPSTG